jgi:hypothetical protein
MGNFVNIGMTFPARDVSVNGVVVKIFGNIVIDSFAALINSAEKSIFVAHETVVLVSCFCVRAY